MLYIHIKHSELIAKFQGGINYLVLKLVIQDQHKNMKKYKSNTDRSEPAGENKMEG